MVGGQRGQGPRRLLVRDDERLAAKHGKPQNQRRIVNSQKSVSIEQHKQVLQFSFGVLKRAPGTQRGSLVRIGNVQLKLFAVAKVFLNSFTQVSDQQQRTVDSRDFQ